MVIEINQWTLDNEFYCKDIGNKSQSYHFLHRKSSEYYILEGWIIETFLILVTVAGAVLGVVNIVYNGTWITITANILSIIVAMLVKYYTNQRYDLVSLKHHYISTEYYSLYDKINYMLSLPIRERVGAKEFINECRIEYQSLMNGINIPAFIVRNFHNDSNVKNLFKHPAMGQLSEIRVNQSDIELTPPVIREQDGGLMNSWRRSIQDEGTSADIESQQPVVVQPETRRSSLLKNKIINLRDFKKSHIQS